MVFSAGFFFFFEWKEILERAIKKSCWFMRARDGVIFWLLQFELPSQTKMDSVVQGM